MNLTANKRLQTPVVFLIFNRPDTTKRVLAKIRLVSPSKLLVVADGPRRNHPEDQEKCIATRALIEQIDWSCEVLREYSDINLGCGRRISSGLHWVFENVPEAIILEDDCLPDISFFRFCEELLERYRDDKRIGIISGNNFRFGLRRTADSYYFSRYTHIWGWASWRKTWQHYDVEMKQWPTVRNGNWLLDIFQDNKLARYWTRIFDRVFHHEIDTWDYQLNFACLINSLFNIMPHNNLVSNIGFGAGSVHTLQKNHLAEIPTIPMKFPLSHPSLIIRDAFTDRFTELDQFAQSFILSRIIKEIRQKIKDKMSTPVE